MSLALVAASLGTAAWLVATGQAASLDGIFLLSTCLVVALAFGLYVGFMIRRALEEVAPPAQPAKVKAAGAAAPKTVAATQVPARQE